MKTKTDLSLPKHRYVTSSKKTGWVKVWIVPIEPKRSGNTDIETEEEKCEQNKN
jgi:hypothetical protein